MEQPSFKLRLITTTGNQTCPRFNLSYETNTEREKETISHPSTPPTTPRFSAKSPTAATIKYSLAENLQRHIIHQLTSSSGGGVLLRKSLTGGSSPCTFSSGSSPSRLRLSRSLFLSTSTCRLQALTRRYRCADVAHFCGRLSHSPSDSESTCWTGNHCRPFASC
ncbi:hypothetical protein VTI74DRAFT_6268 [Chaetomium olivicolor]